MTEYPSGIYALAEPERLSIRTWDPSDDWNNSYLTNGTLYCIPEKKANGWQCVNPRRDYQNDVRLNLSTDTVAKVQAAYTNFTQGVAKLCMLPEHFPGDIQNEYKGNALYVELQRNGTNLQIVAYRQYDAGAGVLGRTPLAPTNFVGYAEGETISLQAGATNVQVYYGTACRIDAPHGLTNIVDAFANGVYPHYEFQNTASTTCAVVQMKALKCRTQFGFGVSE